MGVLLIDPRVHRAMFFIIQWVEIADHPVKARCIRMGVELGSLGAGRASNTKPAWSLSGLSSAKFSPISGGHHLASLEVAFD